MKGEQTLVIKEHLEANNKMHRILPADLDAHAAIRKCPDFMFEKTALQVMIEVCDYCDGLCVAVTVLCA
jgi:hypothetical protein